MYQKLVLQHHSDTIPNWEITDGMEKSKKKSLHPYIIGLGKEIKRLRIQRKFSLEALGAEVGLDASNMQKIEKGQNLTLNSLLKLCICLEISPEKLFDKLNWNLTEKDIDSLSIPRTIKKKSLKRTRRLS